jgi:hypothetical protein
LGVAWAKTTRDDDVRSVRALELDFHGLGLTVPAEAFRLPYMLATVHILDWISTSPSFLRAVIHIKAHADVRDIRTPTSVILGQADAHGARLFNLEQEVRVVGK